MDDIFLTVGMIVVPIYIWLMIRQEKKRKQQKENEEKKELEKKQWQLEIAAKAAAIHEKAQQEMLLRIDKCKTLEGYWEENDAVYQHILSEVNSHFSSTGSRLNQIIWESAKIIYESKSEKTIESRLSLIRDKSKELGYCPINEHEMNILTTHIYINQIKILLEKMSTYKTKSAKQKAWLKVEEFMQRGLKDKVVYQEAFKAFIENIKKSME